MVNNSILTLCILLVLLALTNAELKLVDSRDFLYIMSENNETLYKKEISGFKNYANFTVNNTINDAGLCAYSNDSLSLDTFNEV